ncbi:MAG: DUF3108 domain-containing protein [Thermodesulfobacteriota bacterium]
MNVLLNCRRPEIQLVFICIVTAFIAVSGLTKGTQAAERISPFHPGEKLTFQIKWSFIPAGEAVLAVLPIETINGVESYHFVMLARTHPFIDIFYKVRNRIDAYTDIAMTRSVLYKKKQHEGRTQRDIIVNFDWERMEAQYSNFGEKKDPVSILSGSFDPLSVLYALRLRDLKENTEIEIPVTDGKKSIMGKAKVVRKEKIKLASGTYETYLVKPELRHIGGVFERSKDAELDVWVTADERRIPVKIKSKVMIGSFVAELISVETVGQDIDRLLL